MEPQSFVWCSGKNHGTEQRQPWKLLLILSIFVFLSYLKPDLIVQTLHISCKRQASHTLQVQKISFRYCKTRRSTADFKNVRHSREVPRLPSNREGAGRRRRRKYRGAAFKTRTTAAIVVLRSTSRASGRDIFLGLCKQRRFFML